MAVYNQVLESVASVAVADFSEGRVQMEEERQVRQEKRGLCAVPVTAVTEVGYHSDSGRAAGFAP